MTEIYFPTLAAACRRLGLDDAELAEAALHAVDCGWDEQEAVTMSIVEALQKRGAFHGRLKKAVESGTIFQMAEGDLDGRRMRPMGNGSAGADSSSPSPAGAGIAVDAG